jgi:hypothetical protein
MVMLDETSRMSFFPHWKLRTGSAPDLNDFSIRPRARPDPFEEIKDQSIDWVWHKWLRKLS